jgi:DNA-binding NarL/FixJ family response regulator
MEREDERPDVWDQLLKTITSEEELKKTPDLRAGPEELTARKLRDERLLHTIEAIWPRVDGLSKKKRRSQQKWQRYLEVLQQRLQGKPVKTIAEELECHIATVYRDLNAVIILLQFFDVLLIELKKRLSDPRTQEVLHHTSIGKSPEQISRQLELDMNSIDVAYVAIRREFIGVIEEFLSKAKREAEGIRRLLEAIKQLGE